MRKKTFTKGSLLMMTMLVSSNMMAGTPELESNATSNAVKAHRVLVIGAQDNVKSNYFVTDMLAEDTQINPDSVCYIYNKVIEDNLAQLAQKSKANFTYVDGNAIQGTYHDILKYQEEPFKTIFHYVNYSLYDGNKKKLAQGSNYFTSINPQSEQQMLKASRKSTAKMLNDVESTLTAMRK